MESCIRLTFAKNKWKKDFEEAEINVNRLLGEFNAKNNCNLTIEEVRSESGDLFVDFTTFCMQKSEKEQKYFCNFPELETYIVMGEELIDNNFDFDIVSFILCRLENDFNKAEIIDYYKIYSFYIFDAILEKFSTNETIKNQILRIVNNVEDLSNPLSKEIKIAAQNAKYKKVIDLLPQIWEQEKDFHSFAVFWEYLSQFKSYSKKIEKLVTTYKEKYISERKTCINEEIENERAQNIPPMTTGPIEPEIE